MRRVFITMCAWFFIVATAKSQITKGNTFFGADLSRYIQKVDYSKPVYSQREIKGLSFSPVFGKAVKENLVVGATLGYSVGKDQVTATRDDIKINDYSAGLFVRKYQHLGYSGFFLFVQGGLKANINDVKTDSPSSTSNNTVKRIGFGINIYPGVSYAVGKRLQLETGFAGLLGVGYFNERSRVAMNGEPTYNIKDSGLDITSSLSNLRSALYLGFRVFFN